MAPALANTGFGFACTKPCGLVRGQEVPAAVLLSFSRWIIQPNQKPFSLWYSHVLAITEVQRDCQKGQVQSNGTP
jgi:hypothetical protein